MSNRLMQILASLAQRRALRTLNTICETQHQISTRKLGQYLEPIGDELAGHAFHLRIEYDALTSKVAELESELAKLRAGQEPVLYVNGEHLALALDNPDKEGRSASVSTVKGHYCDTPLYTTPQPSAVPDRWKLVPVEPTRNMIEYAQDEVAKEGVIPSAWLLEIAYQRMLAAAPPAQATVQGARWIPVSQQLPKQNEKVLVTYTNQLGNCRRVIAELVAKHTVEASDDCWGDGADYDEATDQYYCPAGWYECVENWDELAYLAINEGEVTHWMPLPAAPAIAAARKDGGKV